MTETLKFQAVKSGRIFVTLLVGVFATIAQAAPGDAVMAKLDRIVVPVINFEDTWFEEALDFLRLRSVELDPDEDPTRRGISIITKRARPASQDDSRTVTIPENFPPIHYRAENVPLLKALADICRQARLDAYVTSVEIVVGPVGTPPFPNGKAEEGEIWRHLTKTEK